MATDRSRRDPLFGAAVLKLSFLARGEGAAGAFREIYEGVLADLGLSDAQVDAYLEQHRAEVEAALAGKKRT